MTGPYMNAAEVDRVRERASLVDTVARAVELKRRGREFLGRCPFHDERTPSFTVAPEKGFYHCFGCGAHGDVIEFVRRMEGLDFGEALARLSPASGLEFSAPARQARIARDRARDLEDRGRREATAREIWRDARPIAGSDAERYLRGRGITIELPPTLRYAPALGYRHEGRRVTRHPAMVAAIQTASGRIVGVHRTYLAERGGDKAPLADPKRTLGPIRGGAIRFAPVNGSLIVAEGIETALSILQEVQGAAVWAAMAASFMPLVELPPSLKKVIFAVDREASGAGARAGFIAAAQAAERGLEAQVAAAPRWLGDFNDSLRAVG